MPVNYRALLCYELSAIGKALLFVRTMGGGGGGGGGGAPAPPPPPELRSVVCYCNIMVRHANLIVIEPFMILER